MQALFTAALEEDLGPGDLTTLATVDAAVPARGKLIFRDPGVVAGLALFDPLRAAFCARGRADEEAPSLRMTAELHDGARIAAGSVACIIEGNARAVLTFERTFLNFVGRLSGIATLTAAYVEAVRAVGSNARVLDTRKTTPGWRVLEKYAVACGGGHNHRMGLYDAVLIKDNHVVAAGGIEEAVRRALARAPRGVPVGAAPGGVAVEVECDSLDQVERALAAGAKVLLLDNFTPHDVEAAVRLVAGRARIEVSGGLTLETVAAYASAGPDDLSVGRLTHSAPSLDVSLEVELAK